MRIRLRNRRLAQTQTVHRISAVPLRHAPTVLGPAACTAAPPHPSPDHRRVRWCSRCSSAPWPGRPGRPARRTAPRTSGSPCGPGPTGDRAGRPRHHASTCRDGAAAGARCRRCCWRTASAAPRRRVAADARGPRRPRLRRADLDRARASAAAAARSTSTAPTTRSATRSGCWTGWPPGRTSARDAAGDPRVGVVGGSYGGALALLLAGAGPAGRRDRADDHLERPGPRRSCPRPPAADPANGRVQEAVGRPVLRRRSGGARSTRPHSARRCRATAATARALPPELARSTRPAAGSPPTSAPPTSRGHHRPGRRRTRSTCCAGPARPPCSTGSRRRRC